MSNKESINRLRMSSEEFERHLRYFVERWKPEHPQDLYDFQMDLTNIMVAAMQHKSHCLDHGMQIYADATFAHMAMQPLHIIMESKK